jgi:hypothetical protein
MTGQVNEAAQAAVYAQIVGGISYEKRFPGAMGFGSSRVPERGQFFVTGPNTAPLLHMIGYVVQVRLKQGQFGSDNYILRHSDGKLMQHSNNHFMPLTAEELEVVRPFFTTWSPETEDYSHGYTLGSAETHAVEFLVEPPEGFAVRGGEGARMRMTTTCADGSKTVTDTVFL